jgi:hypothetical protein
MLIWTTKIRAIDPMTGELCTYSGPKIQAFSFDDAVKYCQENELGYCEVEAMFIGTYYEENGKGTFDHEDYERGFDLN